MVNTKTKRCTYIAFAKQAAEVRRSRQQRGGVLPRPQKGGHGECEAREIHPPRLHQAAALS